MIKQYFSNHIGHITFNFTVIVLINSFLDYYQIINIGDMMSGFILTLALLFLMLSLIPHSLGYINFRSANLYHLVNFVSQLIVFYIISIKTGLLPMTVDSIIINTILFSLLYFISVKRRKQQLNQLANAINQQLANQKI